MPISLKSRAKCHDKTLLVIFLYRFLRTHKLIDFLFIPMKKQLPDHAIKQVVGEHAIKQLVGERIRSKKYIITMTIFC